MENQEKQIISRKRVADHGEVLTARREVNAMLDLVKPETERIESRFLEPACGTGNFLIAILERKLSVIKRKIVLLEKSLAKDEKRPGWKARLYGPDSLLALSSIYGIDILPDSIRTARARLLDYYLESYRRITGKRPSCELIVRVRFILRKNILQGDAIHTRDQVTIRGVSGLDQIIFTEWRRIGNGLSGREFRFDSLSEKMKFDVIIGNPPYQLNVGNAGGNRSKAKSIYHLFMQSAMNLSPSYLVMITPSRWMTKTNEGIPKKWVDRMLASNQFRIIHDFEDSCECFPGVSIMGGVNYFLWEKGYNGPCHYVYHKGNRVFSRVSPLNKLNCGIVIRDSMACGIIEKIAQVEKGYYLDPERNFSHLVSTKDFYTTKTALTSSWTEFETKQTAQCPIKYYCNQANHKTPFGWIREDQIPKNRQTIRLHKLLIPAANGSRFLILGKPFYAEPGSVCSQTYLVIGYDPEHPFTDKTQCVNVISYIKTRFFRYLVSIKKKTQNGPRGVYQFVPMQDFSNPWTDEELYRKYGLTAAEITFIDSHIRAMD